MSTLGLSDGCEVAASCLNCPLPACRFESPGRHYRQEMLRRNRNIRRARIRGRSVREIISHFGISRRTAFRALGGRV